MSTPTIHMRARDAMIARLNDSRPSDIPESVAGQWFPGDPVRSTEIHVYFHSEDAKPVAGLGGSLNQYELLMVVQPVASAETAAAVDDMLEPLRAWIAQQLGDTNLNGLVHAIQYRGSKWERARADLVYGSAAMGWVLRFQTTRTDFTEVQ